MIWYIVGNYFIAILLFVVVLPGLLWRRRKVITSFVERERESECSTGMLPNWCHTDWRFFMIHEFEWRVFFLSNDDYTWSVCPFSWQEERKAKVFIITHSIIISWWWHKHYSVSVHSSIIDPQQQAILSSLLLMTASKPIHNIHHISSWITCEKLTWQIAVNKWRGSFPLMILVDWRLTPTNNEDDHAKVKKYYLLINNPQQLAILLSLLLIATKNVIYCSHHICSWNVQSCDINTVLQ